MDQLVAKYTQPSPITLFNIQDYILPYSITILTWLLYIRCMLLISKYRKKCKVGFPHVYSEKNPVFNRVFRAFSNQLEQSWMFLVAHWICALFADPRLAFVLGLTWLVLRYKYVSAYELTSNYKILLRYTIPAYLMLNLQLLSPLLLILFQYVKASLL